MKKLIIMIAFLAFGMIAGAQTTYTESFTTNRDASGNFWSSTDTIAENDTIIAKIRVRGANKMNLSFQLNVTKVSGTVTNNFIFAGSNDGENWNNIDTIALSNTASATKFMSLTGFNYSYVQVKAINTATAQKAWYKMFYSFRYD